MAPTELCLIMACNSIVGIPEVPTVPSFSSSSGSAISAVIDAPTYRIRVTDVLCCNDDTGTISPITGFIIHDGTYHYDGTIFYNGGIP